MCEAEACSCWHLVLSGSSCTSWQPALFDVHARSLFDDSHKEKCLKLPEITNAWTELARKNSSNALCVMDSYYLCRQGIQDILAADAPVIAAINTHCFPNLSKLLGHELSAPGTAVLLIMLALESLLHSSTQLRRALAVKLSIPMHSSYSKASATKIRFAFTTSMLPFSWAMMPSIRSYMTRRELTCMADAINRI